MDLLLKITFYLFFISFLPASRNFIMASELSTSNDKASALPDFNKFRKTDSRRFIAFLNSFWRAAASFGWYLALNLENKTKTSHS